MNKYIGVKLVQAEHGYLVNGTFYPSNQGAPKVMSRIEGYQVIYRDGYTSFSPKEVFEQAYMQVGPTNTITQKNVDCFIKEITSETIGTKTALVKATLVNGFEIIKTSSCVDEQNYSLDVGTEICLQKIQDDIWDYLGFLLQTAVGGINGK